MFLLISQGQGSAEIDQTIGSLFPMFFWEKYDSQFGLVNCWFSKEITFPKTNILAPKNDGFQVRNLQTSRINPPFSGGVCG